jgi:hypothetical protein
MSGKFGSRWWWLVAVAALTTALTAGTWRLLTKQTRGAEIATVLALPVAILAAVGAIGATVVAVHLPGRGDENLGGAAQWQEALATLGPHGGEFIEKDEQQKAATELAPFLGRAMTRELFFFAGYPAPLHDAAAELRRAGLLVRGQPHDLGSTWSLKAYSAASALSEKDLAILDGIAERCKVDFDGWGTYVGPLELDDGPGKSQARKK